MKRLKLTSQISGLKADVNQTGTAPRMIHTFFACLCHYARRVRYPARKVAFRMRGDLFAIERAPATAIESAAVAEPMADADPASHCVFPQIVRER